MKVKCLDSDIDFLVDSGASVSILPKSYHDKIDPQLSLTAANGSKIVTYGRVTKKIVLNKKVTFGDGCFDGPNFAQLDEVLFPQRV